MESTGRQWEHEEFIGKRINDAIFEMVHDRCFCEPGSREFVELKSVSVNTFNDAGGRTGADVSYPVRVVIEFSGEPCEFPVIVKLPTNLDSEDAYRRYQNEEVLYNKIAKKYGLSSFVKCYAADLGKYGMPIVVMRDLLADGYKKFDGELDNDHLRLSVKTLAEFHGRGFRLKAEEGSLFKEFCANLCESIDSESERLRAIHRILEVSRSLGRPELTKSVEQRLSPDSPWSQLATGITGTLCHGHFSRDNLLFKHEGGKPIEAKVIGWQTIQHSSAAIDLGALLLRDLSPARREDALSKAQEMLTLYVDAVRRECPKIPVDEFKREIVSMLPYACVVLSLEGRETTDERVREMLLLLHRLSAFN